MYCSARPEHFTIMVWDTMAFQQETNPGHTAATTLPCTEFQEYSRNMKNILQMYRGYSANMQRIFSKCIEDIRQMYRGYSANVQNTDMYLNLDILLYPRIYGTLKSIAATLQLLCILNIQSTEVYAYIAARMPHLQNNAGIFKAMQLSWNCTSIASLRIPTLVSIVSHKSSCLIFCCICFTFNLSISRLTAASICYSAAALQWLAAAKYNRQE